MFMFWEHTTNDGFCHKKGMKEVPTFLPVKNVLPFFLFVCLLIMLNSVAACQATKNRRLTSVKMSQRT